MAQKFVSVNYDMNSYLPEDSPSTVALDVMEDEFDGGIPNARVLIYNVTVPEALSYKEKLGEIDGVTDVTWLDDAVTAKIGELAANGDQEATALYQCAATEITGINDFKRSTFIVAERSRTACRQHAYIAKRQQIISRGSGSIKGRNKRNEGRHKRAE